MQNIDLLQQFIFQSEQKYAFLKFLQDFFVKKSIFFNDFGLKTKTSRWPG